MTDNVFTVAVYAPRYAEWILDIDMYIMDMTGHSVHDFYEVPTESDQLKWPSHQSHMNRQMGRLRRLMGPQLESYREISAS